jgi:hypothetical protein
MSRKRKPRPTVIPDDVYFIDAEQIRKLMAYSRHYFYRYVLSMGEYYGIPPAVVLGPVPGKRYGVCENLRFRADELYALRPDLSPYPKDSSWLARFKDRAAVDRDAYVARREAKRAVERSAAA